MIQIRVLGKYSTFDGLLMTCFLLIALITQGNKYDVKTYNSLFIGSVIKESVLKNTSQNVGDYRLIVYND